MRTVCRPALLCVLGAVLLCGAAAAPDLETRAEKIGGMLMSPCCMTNTVAVHESGASHQMRREIREMLAAGRSEQEILDHYVERHGPQILAVPEARGFSLLPYLFPLAFLIISGWILAIAMRRWHAAVPTGPATPTGPAPDGTYAARLKKELERFD